MRTEHARPDFMRRRTVSLCGKWQFEIADNNPKSLAHYLFENLERTIEVPFAPSSELSGIGTSEPLRSVWYKLKFKVSENEASGSAILNFGAVDFRAEVYVNGKFATLHRGGYSPFNVDIGSLLVVGENSIVVNALDGDNDPGIIAGEQKSAFNPDGTPPVIGIWQPVWLEFTAKQHIIDCRITGVPRNKSFVLEGNIAGELNGELMEVNLSFKGKKLVSYRYRATSHYFLSAPIKSDPVYWEIYQGNLYDIEVKIIAADNVTELDYVKTYGAFRTIELASRKFYLNGDEVTIRAVADRGIFPKGGYTAPSFEAFRQDVAMAMTMGFNAILTRGKIPEPMLLYVADLLGIMVIEEYPTERNPLTSEEAQSALVSEWGELMKRDYGHPSLVIWAASCGYFGQDDNLAYNLYEMTRARDLTRPVIDTTGGVHYRTDIFTKDLSGLEESDFEAKVAMPYNGRPFTEKEIKKHINPYPKALGALTFFNLPCLISAMGAYPLQIGMDFAAEKAYIAKLEKLIGYAEKLNVIGYVFNYLADMGDNLGLVDSERNYKLSREALPLIQKMNKLTLPKKS